MRIGVIGLGAIGGTVAVRLIARGVPLELAGGRHFVQLEKSGAFGGAKVHETLPNDDLYKLILLCTRTSQTTEALTPALPLLAPDGAVVCVQNGLPEERAAQMVGRERVLGAVIGWSASMASPGLYKLTGGGKFIVGGDSRRRHEAVEVLRQAFPARETANLQGARWSKLAINCAMSTIGAVSGLSLGEWAARADARELAIRIVREVVGEGTKRGIRFEAISGLRPDWLARAPSLIAHGAIRLAALRRPAQRTGMIELLRSGRSAGVEDLNALVPGPLNARFVQMVHEIERGAREISPENLGELSK
jgi:2-dehydropantoate 2-reductase